MVEILDKVNASVDLAHKVYGLIVKAKISGTQQALYLGQLLTMIRDKKLYNHLDAENFNEFLAWPELGFQRSTAYSYIRLYEKYVKELELTPEYLSEFGVKRLQIILPFVDESPLEWLSRAQTWSFKDLLNEIRQKKGRQPMKKEVQQEKEINKNYLEYAKSYGCIFHENRKPEMAHFPKTKKVGGLDFIPLCHECHIGELHHVGIDTYLCRHKDKIFGYFFELIEKLYKEVKNEFE